MNGVFSKTRSQVVEGEERKGEDLILSEVEIDLKVKELLANYSNGEFIPVDIVSHMEYFYNTNSMGC